AHFPLTFQSKEDSMFTRFTRAALVASLALATSAFAQDFPTKPVTLVMPDAAGGPGDTLARLVAQSMTATLKQQVIVENAAGAGGTIGATKVATAKPEGGRLRRV